MNTLMNIRVDTGYLNSFVFSAVRFGGVVTSGLLTVKALVSCDSSFFLFHFVSVSPFPPFRLMEERGDHIVEAYDVVVDLID